MVRVLSLDIAERVLRVVAGCSRSLGCASRVTVGTLDRAIPRVLSASGTYYRKHTMLRIAAIGCLIAAILAV